LNSTSNKKSYLQIAISTVATLFLTAILFTYTNCSSNHDPSQQSYASIDTVALLSSLRAGKETVLESKCATCHNSAATDTSLTNITETQYLIDEDYINAGSPQTSPLYISIIDEIMPPADSPQLSDNEKAILRDWIAAEGGNFDSYIGGTPIDPGTGGGGAAFSQVRAVLTQNCTSCHRAGGTPPRLDVDAPTLRGTIYQGAPLVIPNNAAGSRLLQSFGRMPTSQALGTNSSAANTIRNWINTGAQ
jgi:uncharacterized membrane protein